MFKEIETLKFKLRKGIQFFSKNKVPSSYINYYILLQLQDIYIFWAQNALLQLLATRSRPCNDVP